MITVQYLNENYYNEPVTTVCDVAIFGKEFVELIDYDNKLKKHVLEKVKINKIVYIMETLK